MITIEAVRTLFAYDMWATGRTLEACAGLPASEFAAGEGRGSLHGTLVHIVEAKSTWLSRWRSGRADHRERIGARTLDELRAAARELERHTEEYLLEVDDAELDREIVFTHPSGTRHVERLWQQMLHVVIHGTQHRSEAALMLTDLGRSPGALDFLVFLEQMP